MLTHTCTAPSMALAANQLINQYKVDSQNQKKNETYTQNRSWYQLIGKKLMNFILANEMESYIYQFDNKRRNIQPHTKYIMHEQTYNKK